MSDDQMTAEEIGTMAAAEMVVAHAPALAARTIFRHQRQCSERAQRLHNAEQEVERLREALTLLRDEVGQDMRYLSLDCERAVKAALASEEEAA